MSAQFRLVSSTAVRDVIAQGDLPELEFALLKKHAEKLRWSTAEKASFCNMMTDVLEAKLGEMEMQILVRSFCHSAKVVSDYLTASDRFNTRQVLLVIGDVGAAPSPWASLIQQAVFLHGKGFNIVSIEVPSLATSTNRYLKYGPAIIRDTLKFMKIDKVHTLASRNGGCIFLEAMGDYPKVFGPTHFVYNIDCPSGGKAAPFPVFKLEECLRENSLQFWFAVNDEDGYNHFEEGTARQSFDAVVGMQSRLEGERRRGRRSQDYDEILLSDTINAAKVKHIKRVDIGRNSLEIFSDVLLNSLVRFFESPPCASQSDLDTTGGIIRDVKTLGELKPGEELPELPALRCLRIGEEAFEAEVKAKANAAAEVSQEGGLAQLLLEARQRELPKPSEAYLRERKAIMGQISDFDAIINGADLNDDDDDDDEKEDKSPAVGSPPPNVECTNDANEEGNGDAG